MTSQRDLAAYFLVCAILGVTASLLISEAWALPFAVGVVVGTIHSSIAYLYLHAQRS